MPTSAERSSISPVRERVKEAKEIENQKKKLEEKKKMEELLTNKTGGAYIPPARLRAMQGNISDKNSLGKIRRGIIIRAA